MKKVVFSLSIILVVVFLVGCLDYKSYDIPPEEDLSLLDEIAQIEEELNLASGNNDINDELLEKSLDEEVVKEVVLPKLDEPVISENEPALDDVQIVTVNENELIKLNVKVSDPDQDQVTYSFTRPLNDKGEWQTNYGDAGEYLVTLTATDGIHTIEKKIRVVVKRVNVAPVIEKLVDLSIKEGETVSVDPKVSDPNGDPVSVTLSEPLKSGTFLADHNSAGEYQIKVIASDGELEAETSFKILIEDVNELPQLSGLFDLVVSEGDVVKIEPIVTDLDGDDVTVTISEPVGDDGVWETGYTDKGEYFVIVTASDDKDTVTKNVKLVVEDVNMPPEFLEVSLAVN